MRGNVLVGGVRVMARIECCEPYYPGGPRPYHSQFCASSRGRKLTDEQWAAWREAMREEKGLPGLARPSRGAGKRPARRVPASPRKRGGRRLCVGYRDTCPWGGCHFCLGIEEV